MVLVMQLKFTNNKLEQITNGAGGWGLPLRLSSPIKEGQKVLLGQCMVLVSEYALKTPFKCKGK